MEENAAAAPLEEHENEALLSEEVVDVASCNTCIRIEEKMVEKNLLEENQSKENGAEAPHQIEDLLEEEVHDIVHAPLAGVWELVSDFCGLNKWVPTVKSCEAIHDGKIGIVRRPVAFPSQDGSVTWVCERLVLLDPASHTLVYRVEDGNIGLNDYVATLKLFPTDQPGATRVSWSFKMSPSSARSKETQSAYLKWGIHNLEKAASITKHPNSTFNADMWILAHTIMAKLKNQKLQSI